jgi:hypothetical protein
MATIFMSGVRKEYDLRQFQIAMQALSLQGKSDEPIY